MFGILKAFLGLSPAIVAGVSLFGGAGVVLAGFMVWNVLIDNPHLWERAEDVCTIRTMDAANRAEKAERDRQAASVRAATEAYEAALSAQERERRLTEQQLETERSRYEMVLEGEGRRCGLLPADLEWLRQQSDARDGG